MDILKRFKQIRLATENICRPLEIEDYAVQPCVDVSPPKWHLAHTTWLFEEVILSRLDVHYKRFNEGYTFLFNSYYKAAGEHWVQSKRGHLSRPTVKEIFEYRHYVDNHIEELFAHYSFSHQDLEIFEVALNHEQQHQELLYMDIKYILGANPSMPPYKEGSAYDVKVLPADKNGSRYKEDLYLIGHSGHDFSYDNERPEHKEYVYSFSMDNSMVTNGEFLQFIEDGGYQNARLWPSMGYDWVKKEGISSPLYWFKEEDEWFEFSLSGKRLLDLQRPVSHVSYFEASAFSVWKNKRLPTESESEVFLRDKNEKGPLWFWTSSQYEAYPGYRPYEGMIAEYNGKFMCNQFILRGGCFLTPKEHYRNTYRNFYLPHQRWMFSGIRLAKDL